MASFHLFPRLPLELRIQIWGLSTEDRVLNVKRDIAGKGGFWSPDQVPGVTRASQESRKYCSYQKAFIVDSSPRYLWADFEYDTIQIRGILLSHISYPPEPDREQIKHLIVEMIDDWWKEDEDEEFYFYNMYNLRDFPRVKSFLVLETRGIVSKITKCYVRSPDGNGGGIRDWVSSPVA